jgi:hypothetical protein
MKQSVGQAAIAVRDYDEDLNFYRRVAGIHDRRLSGPQVDGIRLACDDQRH